jgi:hypothetical protein
MFWLIVQEGHDMGGGSAEFDGASKLMGWSAGFLCLFPSEIPGKNGKDTYPKCSSPFASIQFDLAALGLRTN